MSEKTTKTIYRPQGKDPVGAMSGDRLFGIVHRGVPIAEADFLIVHKKFVEVPDRFDPKKDTAPAALEPKPLKPVTTEPEKATTTEPPMTTEQPPPLQAPPQEAPPTTEPSNARKAQR